MKVRTAITLALFAVGLLSSAVLGIWLISGIIFIFGDAPYPGDIAYIPKWIFLFTPLVFLGYRKEVQELEEIILEKMG